MAPNESKTTTDHDEIRRWAQERGGRPARVKGTERGDDGDALEPISWEEFFDEFDREGLAFLYQEKTADGQLSRFNKFVRR